MLRFLLFFLLLSLRAPALRFGLAILREQGIHFKRLFERTNLDKKGRNSKCIFFMAMVSVKKALY
jgi:hypothetical protein